MRTKGTGPSDIRYPSRHFGRLLGELVDAADLPQSAIAVRADVSSRTFSAYKTGRTLPELNEPTLDKLADALATTARARPRIRRELERRLHLDLYAAHLAALGHTPAIGIELLRELGE